MRPRTKEQELIVKLTNQQRLTDKQRQYAIRHCFNDHILESRKHCFCTNCKHEWKTDDTFLAYDVCPHCGNMLSVIHGKRRHGEKEYFSVLTTKNNMQVIVWYLVMRAVSKNYDNYSFIHVGTEWIGQDGMSFSVELPRFTATYIKDSWSYGPMELRKKSVFARYLMPSAVYNARVLPILKRNGWKKLDLFRGYESFIACSLLKSREFESWFKVGHYGVCKSYILNERNNLMNNTNYSMMTEEKGVLVKLANRKHIVFNTLEKWIDYNDYLKDLRYMGYDIHNPSILLPDNFEEAHRTLSERATRRRDDIRRLEDQRRRIDLMEKADIRAREWLKKYSVCFGDLKIVAGEFTLKPLVSKYDFSQEAKCMHHCIASYYGKADTLLLSVEHSGEKCETVEVLLPGTGAIIQSRGKYNQSTEFHDQIIKIVNDNMGEFTKRFKKSREIVTTTLPVPINHYQNFKIAI